MHSGFARESCMTRSRKARPCRRNSKSRTNLDRRHSGNGNSRDALQGETLKIDNNIGMIVVDYLQLMQGPNEHREPAAGDQLHLALAQSAAREPERYRGCAVAAFAGP
jgi:hypothetical protein